MTRSLTPAATRAAAEAACWNGRSPSATPDADAAIGLLLALALQSECRAAEMLAAAGIDAEGIRQRWPQLTRHAPDDDSLPHVTPEVRRLLHAAEQQLDEFSQPASLATEHLLLGVVAVTGPAADWLAARGLPLAHVVAEIERLHGIDRRPVDWEEPAEGGPEPAALAPAPPRIATAQVVRAVDEAPWRILDAAANRAREALRVVEDLARFGRDAAETTEQLKSLRHALAETLERFPTARLLAARDVGGDVGTTITTPRESHRADLPGVATANFKRLQESLRSLEEIGKLLDVEAARRFEQLRYQAYALESLWFAPASRRSLLEPARLYVLVDGRESVAAFEALIVELIEAGVDALQLRDKRLPDRELLERARLLRAATRGTATLAIINDRPDLAQLSEADGVHVGQEELSVADARRIVGPDALVGLSTHSLEQARAAALEGADYLGVGPVFASRTKRFSALSGVELVRAVSTVIALPCFAIGGIDLGNLDPLLAAGATRIAVSAAVLDAPRPGAAARELRARLDSIPR